MSIRAATPDDAAAMADLGVATIPAAYGPIDPALVRHQLENWWTEDVLAERIARLPHWVAEDGGRVLGVSDLGRLDGRARVWKMYVRPEAQGQGLGRELLRRSLDAAAGEDVWLDVFAENDQGIGFYRSQGFEPVDEEGTTVLGHASVRMRRPA